MTTTTTRKALAVLGLGLILGSGLMPTAAQADDHDRGRRGPPPRHYEPPRRHHHWHGGPAPVVYAPPPVYAPPEPVSTGINLVLPLNFR